VDAYLQEIDPGIDLSINKNLWEARMAEVAAIQYWSGRRCHRLGVSPAFFQGCVIHVCICRREKQPNRRGLSPSLKPAAFYSPIHLLLRLARNTEISKTFFAVLFIYLNLTSLKPRSWLFFSCRIDMSPIPLLDTPKNFLQAWTSCYRLVFWSGSAGCALQCLQAAAATIFFTGATHNMPASAGGHWFCVIPRPGAKYGLTFGGTHRLRARELGPQYIHVVQSADTTSRSRLGQRSHPTTSHA